MYTLPFGHTISSHLHHNIPPTYRPAFALLHTKMQHNRSGLYEVYEPEHWLAEDK